MSGPCGGMDGGRPAHCLGRSVEELQERPAGTESGVGELQKRDTEAQSVQAGQESALNDSNGLDAVVSLELAVYLISDTRKLQRADGAQVVDQQNELIPGLMGEVSAIRVVVIQDLQKHGLDQLRKSSLDPVGSRLVVNTHSDLDFTVGNGILGYASTRDVDMR